MEFEDEFDMEISDDDAEKIATVGDAVNYIQKANKLSPLKCIERCVSRFFDFRRDFSTLNVLIKVDRLCEKTIETEK